MSISDADDRKRSEESPAEQALPEGTLEPLTQEQLAAEEDRLFARFLAQLEEDSARVLAEDGITLGGTPASQRPAPETLERAAEGQPADAGAPLGTLPNGAPASRSDAPGAGADAKPRPPRKPPRPPWSPAILYRTQYEKEHAKKTRGPAKPPAPPPEEYHVVPLIAERAGDIQSAYVEWVWPQRIPRGRLSLLAGDPGIGKSFVALDIAARVSRGGPWPDWPHVTQKPENVLVFSMEDDLQDTIRPRLVAAGADLSRISVVDGIMNVPSRRDERVHRRFCIPNDLRTLHRVIFDLKPLKLIVLDPVMGYCGRGDGTGVSSIHAMLAPVAALAARTGVTILGTIHLRGGSGKSVYRAAGNPAFTTAARAVFGLSRDPDTPGKRLMMPVKLNLAPDGAGLSYRIEDGGKLVWDDQLVPAGREDGRSGNETGGRKEREATERLRELLKGGWCPASEVWAMAAEHGFGRGTVHRAGERIGATSKRDGGRGGCWFWVMKDGTPTANGGSETGPDEPEPSHSATAAQFHHECENAGILESLNQV